MLDMH
jgi:hypothetical protein